MDKIEYNRFISSPTLRERAQVVAFLDTHAFEHDCALDLAVSCAHCLKIFDLDALVCGSERDIPCWIIELALHFIPE